MSSESPEFVQVTADRKPFIRKLLFSDFITTGGLDLVSYANYNIGGGGTGTYFVFKTSEKFKYVRVGRTQVIYVQPGMDRGFKYLEPAWGYPWKLMIDDAYSFRVKSIQELGELGLSYTVQLGVESEWEVLIVKSKADYSRFVLKWMEFVSTLEGGEERFRDSQLHFYAGSALRSARSCQAFPWCLHTNYDLIGSKLDELLPQLQAGLPEDDLKRMLVLSSEFSVVFQHLHEHSVSVSESILDKIDLSRPIEEIPWLFPAFQPLSTVEMPELSRSLRSNRSKRFPTSFDGSIGLVLSPLSPPSSQDQYRFDAIKAHFSNIRPDLTSTILDWLHKPSFQQAPVLLITGDGGVGKSTLVRAVCSQLAQAGRLHGSFFFDAKHGRSDMASQLFENLAVDLDRWHGRLRSGPVWKNKQQYVLKPDHTILGETLVVIDAVDECEEQNRLGFVTNLASAIPEFPSHYRFLITSRHIDATLDPLLSLPRHLVQTVDMNQLDDSARILLLNSLTPTFGNLPWVTDVVNKSAGLPRFAVTACRFVINGNEQERLNLVLDLDPREGQSPLFALYSAILPFLFPTDAERAQFQTIFTQVLFSRIPLSIADHEELISVDDTHTTSSSEIINKIGPLIGMERDYHPEQPVQILEKSFNDFITDRDESGPYFVVPEWHSAITRRCLNLLSRTIPGPHFSSSALRSGLVSNTATLWPRHAIKALPHLTKDAEQTLRLFILHRILYWARPASVSDIPFRDYLPLDINENNSRLLTNLINRLLSLLQSRFDKTLCHTRSFERFFMTSYRVPQICSKGVDILYGRLRLLCFDQKFSRWPPMTKVHAHSSSIVTCPALLQFGSTTLLACVRSFESRLLQVRTVYGEFPMYEARVERRVVEMIATEPHLVVVYDDGSIEQFSFKVDFANDTLPFSKRRVKGCNAIRSPISVRLDVPACNFARRIKAVHPTTGAVALTFNCGTDGHLLTRSCSVTTGADIAYWNCETRMGYSLKLPGGTPAVSHLLFNRDGGATPDLEHLAAVTAAGSLFIWRITSTESHLAGEFSQPSEMTLPRLFAFEYLRLDKPALELFSLKWEDGTVALYDAQLCSLLHWVKARPAVAVPCESLEVEEADPEGIDLEELGMTTPGDFPFF